MLGLWCKKTYGAMTNHDGGDDNGNNDGNNNGNEDWNNEDNVAFGLGSDGPIFDLIFTPWSRLSLTEDDQATTTMALRTRHHMYLRVGIYLPYKYPINAIVNMCHKLLYTNIGILDLCCWNMKKNSWINKRIDYILDIYNGRPLIACPWFSWILTRRCPKQPTAKASKTVP